MTNAELREWQQRQRRLQARVKTISGELRAEDRALSTEAAEVIDWLAGRVEQLRQNLNEEIRDGQRGAAIAYAEGQTVERERSQF